MIYILMHKNIEVADLDISTSGKISNIEIRCEYHMPVGGSLNKRKFEDWWNDRAVPKTRKGVNNALKKLGFSSTNSMLLNNLALSLTDCYWVRPIKSNLTWEIVSLFRNDFTDIFGELTFNSNNMNMQGKTIFKHATSQGELQKKWCIDNNGRRFLVKGNWGNSFQQSLNEVLASEIHKMQMRFPYTQYYLTPITVENNEIALGCYSYDFCNENIELVPAWDLLQSIQRKQSDSMYHTLVNLCVNKCKLNKNYVEEFLWYQILTDYIMTNTDRHMNNIALLRNPDTLEYYGFAPIYDTGNSMFFRSSIKNIGNTVGLEFNSFADSEAKLLKYVQNKKLVDTTRLPDDTFLTSLYNIDTDNEHRVKHIVSAYNTKIYRLRDMQIK